MNSTHNARATPPLKPVLSPESGHDWSQETGVGSGSGGLWVTSLLSVTLMVMCTMCVAGMYTIIITRSAAMRRTGSMYIYLINSALADLVYLSTTPFVVCTYLAHDWLFGEAGCHILLSLVLLTTHAGVFILVAISLDRYSAMAQPFSAHRPLSCRHRFVAGTISTGPHEVV